MRRIEIVYQSAVHSGCEHHHSLGSPTYDTAVVATSKTNKEDYSNLCQTKHVERNISSENKGACDRLFKAKHGLCNGQDHEALLQEKS